ncbi:MAG: hypothetical protein JNM56_30710 [Planctomycetia bacterium]|nr:hypothetical protein [Planctomycetia bacterium]
MRMHRYPFLVLCSLLVGSALFTPESGAQKGQPPAGPQAPNLAMPMPLGMQRGSSFELVLTGANLAEPVALMTSIPGLKATFPEDNNNGKDAAKLRVLLEAPKDAPLGTHTLRLVTARGMSNLRLFCLDDLPQTNQDAASKVKSTPQALTVPGVVAGRIDAEGSNFYKINVQAGQRLSFDVLGRRLGSPIDPLLSITDLKNQREVAYSNDAPGQQTDARLTHTFKEAGEYLIEIRDVMHRGGADYVYRLRVGDFPCATTPVPMAAKRGSKVNVAFAGPAVEGVAPVEVNVPSDPAINTVWVAPKGASGLHGWPVALVVSDYDEVVEQEPNNDPAKATPVPVPGGVTGRFEQKSDVDYFKLPLKKGRWLIEAQTLELYSPTEVYMALKDGKGADVAKLDPKAAPRLDYTAKDDGDHTLAVEHLHYWGGPGETYRITVTPYEPTIEVTLGSERFDLPQGSAALVPIQAITAKDYKGPVELSVVGHPGVTGTKTISSEAKGQNNQPAALMLISAAPDVPMGGYPIRVQAKAMINGKPVVAFAHAKPTLSQSLGGLPFPPRQLIEQQVVAITEKPPFTLTAKFDLPETLKGGNAVLTISAARAEGFDGEIALAPIGLPANVTTAVKSIPKGSNEFKAELKVAAGAAYGDFPISFNGKAKHGNKDFSVIAAPVSLVVALPFDLKVEPSPLKIDVGEKAKVKVVAVRKGGYNGPIAVEVKGLPANVTAAKGNIDMDKNEVELEISAAANAAAGEKADVNVVGTAPAAANQQNTSPNFTIAVNKK